MGVREREGVKEEREGKCKKGGTSTHWRFPATRPGRAATGGEGQSRKIFALRKRKEREAQSKLTVWHTQRGWESAVASDTHPQTKSFFPSLLVPLLTFPTLTCIHPSVASFLALLPPVLGPPSSAPSPARQSPHHASSQPSPWPHERECRMFISSIAPQATTWIQSHSTTT